MKVRMVVALGEEGGGHDQMGIQGWEGEDMLRFM